MGDMFDDLTHWEDDNKKNAYPQSLDHTYSHSLPPLPPSSRKEMRKLRKQKKLRKARRSILIVFLVLFLSVGSWGIYRVASHIGRVHTVEINSIDDYTGSGTGSVNFIIENGQSAQVIANNLVKAHIIKNAQPFINEISLKNAVLYPGSYALKYHMPAKDVASILSNPQSAQGILHINPGDKVRDVVNKLASASKISLAQIKQFVNSGGQGILPPEAHGNFEGWLEPGSYVVASDTSVYKVIKNIVAKRIQKLDLLGYPHGEERENLLKMASIAESEVNSQADYSKVTRVILNRLAKNMPLGMDTVVAYGLGISGDKLTDAQLNDPSNPYNARIRKGLPPTPISNPSDTALRAALYPAQGDWLYFVTTNLKTGETKFATTEQEFETIRQEYKNSNAHAN